VRRWSLGRGIFARVMGSVLGDDLVGFGLRGAKVERKGRGGGLMRGCRMCCWGRFRRRRRTSRLFTLASISLQKVWSRGAYHFQGRR
jgi:hypothetical protein